MFTSHPHAFAGDMELDRLTPSPATIERGRQAVLLVAAMRAQHQRAARQEGRRQCECSWCQEAQARGL